VRINLGVRGKKNGFDGDWLSRDTFKERAKNKCDFLPIFNF
jgi:hypothetical protein